MKRYLLLLFFPLMLATCTRNNDVIPNSKLIGRWSLAAKLDSTGKWQQLLFPLESGPPVIEFRRDFSVDYINSNGESKRGCCQPTRYTFTLPEPCPIGAVCLQTAGTINFTAWVSCPTVNCTPIKFWTTASIDDTFLDIYAPPEGSLTGPFRYQRLK